MFLVPNPHPRKHARESRSKKFFHRNTSTNPKAATVLKEHYTTLGTRYYIHRNQFARVDTFTIEWYTSLAFQIAMAFKYSYMSFNFGILHTISARKARCRFCTLLISNYTYSRLLNATCFTCLVSKINFAKCFQPFQASILGVSTSLGTDTFFVQNLYEKSPN